MQYFGLSNLVSPTGQRQQRCKEKLISHCHRSPYHETKQRKTFSIIPTVSTRTNNSNNNYCNIWDYQTGYRRSAKGNNSGSNTTQDIYVYSSSITQTKDRNNSYCKYFDKASIGNTLGKHCLPMSLIMTKPNDALPDYSPRSPHTPLKTLNGGGWYRTLCNMAPGKTLNGVTGVERYDTTPPTPDKTLNGAGITRRDCHIAPGKMLNGRDRWRTL